MPSNGSSDTPFGDISIAEFLADYWQQKPLLVRQAFPGVDDLLSADELAGLSLEPEVESRYIEETTPHQFSLTHGPFEETFFADRPESRWTLLVQAVNHFAPDIESLMNAFDFIPRWRMDDVMVSYATDGGSVGPHYDQYDVFLIQGAGKRRWQVGPKQRTDAALLDNPDLRILADMTVEEDWVLEPGDMLYLPPMYAHHGVAQGECMTFSVGFRAPQLSFLLGEMANLVAENASDDVFFSDANRAESQKPGFFGKQDIQAIQQWITESLMEPDQFKQLIAQSLSAPKYAEDAFAIEDSEPQTIAWDALDSDYLYRNPKHRFIYTHRPHCLFIDGYKIPGQLSTSLIEYLCNHNEWPVETLRSLALSSDDQQLLGQLFDNGVIVNE